jgi:hypothetical protein
MSKQSRWPNWTKFLAVALIVSGSLVPPAMGREPDDKKNADKKINDNIKEIAGTAEFLRSVPKHFATLKAIDSANHSVTLLIEGETLPKVWPLTADAEIKILGWWGRLSQLVVGDRVWVWFKTDRNKQPVAISMLADEISEQQIHDLNLTVVSRDDKTLTLKSAQAKNRTLPVKKTGTATVKSATPKIGEHVFVQGQGDGARLILNVSELQEKNKLQRAALRKVWESAGLPGTITFLHIFSGEMELMLDHEAMRWGRSLRLGDKVALQVTPPIAGVVKTVQPWRERTLLRLVVNGQDQADLSLGQRIGLKMDTPPAEIDSATLPPDIGRPRGRGERIDWFLASIYCTCGVANNTCTGHFYTLASCNPNGCGHPNMIRKEIGEKIDKGLSDKQIFEELIKEQGASLLRQHLAP